MLESFSLVFLERPILKTPFNGCLIKELTETENSNLLSSKGFQPDNPDVSTRYLFLLGFFYYHFPTVFIK